MVFSVNQLICSCDNFAVKKRLLLLLLIFGINRPQRLNQTDKNIYFSDSLLLRENFITGAVNEPKEECTIIFVSTGCGYCNQLIDYLNTRKKTNRQANFIYVFSESLDNVKAFIQTRNLLGKNGSAVYLDINTRLRSIFDLKTVPAVFVISNHRLIQKGIGVEQAKEILNDD